MATLRTTAQQIIEEARDGIAWIALYKEGRGYLATSRSHTGTSFGCAGLKVTPQATGGVTSPGLTKATESEKAQGQRRDAGQK